MPRQSRGIRGCQRTMSALTPGLLTFYVSLPLTTLTLVSIGFFLYCYARLPDIRTLQMRLILQILCSSFFDKLGGYFAQGPSGGRPVFCALGYGLMTLGFFAKWTWSAVLSYSLVQVYVAPRFGAALFNSRLHLPLIWLGIVACASVHYVHGVLQASLPENAPRLIHLGLCDTELWAPTLPFYVAVWVTANATTAACCAYLFVIVSRNAAAHVPQPAHTAEVRPRRGLKERVTRAEIKCCGPRGGRKHGVKWTATGDGG